jgi:hypothetical protein
MAKKAITDSQTIIDTNKRRDPLKDLLRFFINQINHRRQPVCAFQGVALGAKIKSPNLERR